jgi:AcrR family transcriptional regulator
MTDKRAMILNVAEELFGEHGYEGTSTRMLATKAGVNVAMISYYFGSKEKLFEALVEERTRFMREHLQFLNRNVEDSWEKIELAIEAYVDRIFSNHRFHRILYREISLQQRNVMSENIVEILYKSSAEFRKIITDGQAKKDFADVDVELTCATIMGTISKVALSSKFSCKMIGASDEDSFYSPENALRLKKHLKDLIRIYLKPR